MGAYKYCSWKAAIGITHRLIEVYTNIDALFQAVNNASIKRSIWQQEICIVMVHKDSMQCAARTMINVDQSAPGNVHVACHTPGSSPNAQGREK